MILNNLNAYQSSPFIISQNILKVFERSLVKNSQSSKFEIPDDHRAIFCSLLDIIVNFVMVCTSSFYNSHLLMRSDYNFIKTNVCCTCKSRIKFYVTPFTVTKDPAKSTQRRVYICILGIFSGARSN